MMNMLKLLTVCALALSLFACAKNPEPAVDLYQQDSYDGIVTTDLNSASQGYFEQNIDDRVFFAVDQSFLTSQAMVVLDRQAKWFLDNPQIEILIEGHADEQGTREYNLALGARRASQVSNYLVNQGISERRIKTITYGKERPVELCSNEICYTKNRRAVTVITAGING